MLILLPPSPIPNPIRQRSRWGRLCTDNPGGCRSNASAVVRYATPGIKPEIRSLHYREYQQIGVRVMYGFTRKTSANLDDKQYLLRDVATVGSLPEPQWTLPGTITLELESWPGCPLQLPKSHLRKTPCAASWERCFQGCDRSRDRHISLACAW